jgi:hypothetical protein
VHLRRQRLNALAGGNAQHRAGAADLIPWARLTVGNTLQVCNFICAQS